MDLVFSVGNPDVAMTDVNNKGGPKIVKKSSCPLNAPRCMRRIFSDIALIDVMPEGLVLREVLPGPDPGAVQAKTEPPLRVASDCREMKFPANFNGVQPIA